MFIDEIEGLLKLPGLGTEIGGFKSFEAFSYKVENSLNHKLKYFGFNEEIKLSFSSDIGMTSWVRKRQDTFIIEVPVGLYLRASFLARKILQLLPEPHFVNFIESALDGLDQAHYFIPSYLRPALLDHESTEAFIKDYTAYWDENIDDKVYSDLKYLRQTILLHNIMHEFGHIARGHFDLRSSQQFEQKIEEIDQRFKNERFGILPRLTVQNSLELDADFAQGSFITENDCLEITNGQSNGGLLGFQSSLAACIHYCLSDAKKCQISSYRKDYHMAPILRYELVSKAANCYMNFFLAVHATNSSHGILEQISRLAKGWSQGYTEFQMAVHKLRAKNMKNSREAEAYREENPGMLGIPALNGMMVGGMMSATTIDKMFGYVQKEYYLVSEEINKMNTSAKKGMLIKFLSDEEAANFFKE